MVKKILFWYKVKQNIDTIVIPILIWFRVHIFLNSKTKNYPEMVNLNPLIT